MADLTQTEPVESAVPFDRFMASALYGPEGFYTRSGRAGRRGDFITSPEVGPLFGAVVARFLDDEWERLGRPDPFTFVDAGAGPGTLARSVFAAEPVCSAALRCLAVEISGQQRALHPDNVISLEALPTEPIDGVIVANELLDNLPFRLAVYDDGWREAFVVELPDGSLVEQLSAPFDPRPEVLPPRPALGSRAPLQESAHHWIQTARRLLRTGSLVIVDYITPTTAELAIRPWRDWLRTYRGHGRGGHYLEAPGTQDITAEVALDQLPEPDAIRSQAQWLQLHGVDELVEAGKHYWKQHADHPDVAAMRMRSRVSESEALLDPAGLGAFTVVEYRA